MMADLRNVLWLAALFAGTVTTSQGEAREGWSRTACAAAERYSAGHDGVTFLVLHQGNIVCEGYANGGSAERAYGLASGTKSFSGILAAAAVQDGLLALDEPVSDTIAEWRGDPARAAITIRELIGLVSGIPGGGPVTGRATPTYAQALEIRPVASPGAQFQYGATPFQIFGEVIRRKLAAHGDDADPVHYLERRVLDPIGLTDVKWRRLPDGNPTMAAGAALTARQWARFGEFVRQGGTWQGKALVDPAAFAELFRGSRANPAYGLGWWLALPVPRAQRPRLLQNLLDLQDHAGELPGGIVMALGAGHQRLYVVPGEKLVIVRQTDNARRRAQPARGAPDIDDGKWSDTTFLKLVLGPQAAS